MSYNQVLIVASSGRMLAQSALRAGLVPFVIDLYADRDTQNLAKSFQVLNSLDAVTLAPAVEYLQSRFNLCNVIYGSGLENHPESIIFLEDKFHLLGNSASKVRKVQDKRIFFNALGKFDIPFPEVVFSVPQNLHNWLLKPLHGEGGMGIMFADTTKIEKSNIYWQRHIDGIPMSVLFIADGRCVRIIGFNRQWTKALDTRQHFVFAGAINQAELPWAEKSKLERWLSVLVPFFLLKGINCLDFIWDGMQSWILEINPRPSASMMLYDADFKKGLLNEHIQSCTTTIEQNRHVPKKMRAFEILYATGDLQVPDDFVWPQWSLNQPVAGCIIHTKQPICSIIASGQSPQHVMDGLRIRKRIIINEINKSN